MKYLPTSVSVCLFMSLGACDASDEDCAKLGDKFVMLYTDELSEDSKKLGPKVLANAAEAGRAEVVDQCKKQTYSKDSVNNCLDAQTMAEFKKC